MAKVLLMIIGLLVLGIGGLGGLLWNAGNQSIDAQSFKSAIKGNCNRLMGSQLGRLAEDEEVQDTVKDICKCAADMAYGNFKDQPPIKLVSLTQDPKARAKIKQITLECLERADIPTEFELPQQADASEEDMSEE
jgi:hypothetical protein